ncbi:phosphoglycerate kinase [Candidatus Saccharibacteria bacterium]|nr:phosphoglycerate kinase [Candidatus Saccharibacteria bacterium]
MSFTKKTVKDISLNGKTVLVRADYNVPVEDGKITDDYRIKQSVPTIEYLLKQKCKIVICSHLGRPKGKRDLQYSLAPVANRLNKLLNHEVYFVADSIGKPVERAVSDLKPGQILLLENLRFYPQEEENDKTFAKQLASLADVFVEDGFGVVHRAHASTEGVTHFLPSVAGLLLEQEVATIKGVMDNPKRPLMAIIGGAKIADKIEIIDTFIKSADVVVIGGAMANTFLKAKGVDIEKSLSEPKEVSIAKDIIKNAEKEALKRPFVFFTPHDSVAVSKIDKTAKTRIVDWTAHVIATLENYPKRPPKHSGKLEKDEIIVDIGPYSGAFIAGSMQLANTVIWNGTMGITETPAIDSPIGPFAHGTEIIIEALLGEYGHKPYSLIGGGDTSAYVQERGLVDCFNHVSTGGGASLDLMAGKKLPGVEALQDKGRK